MQKMDPEPASKVEIIRNMSSEMDCFAFVPTICGQIKTFCFRSDNKWTKAKCFVSIYKFLDYIETFYFAQDNFQTKSNCFALYQNF
jgi:hypothetical protein